MEFVTLLELGTDLEPSRWNTVQSGETHTLMLGGAGEAIVDVQVAFDGSGTEFRNYITLRGHVGDTAIRQITGPMRYRCVRRRGETVTCWVTAITRGNVVF